LLDAKVMHGGPAIQDLTERACAQETSKTLYASNRLGMRAKPYFVSDTVEKVRDVGPSPLHGLRI
jgi:hypothetical protein